MGQFLFPITIAEHRMLLDAFALGGRGEAVRVFRRLFPAITDDGFVEVCTGRVIGEAWDASAGRRPAPHPSRHRW
ncbi:hypothetical protein HL658_29020 [Azospirillum sp. RWY-5-1]|uniref:Uncharacterized protein n=1 Tax=Azospirillum oleiclasticum TaxID=2735135 RepID=A0ABX2TLU9_9PROT|nr:hypothetical protein [Azospirillum oleiclasticum]NYZ16606.1 hypothetical protein [Azospirillum oleiclasticum]NYZ24093.1 hypothetical protein [Azospirillum oleiclasticum]